MRQVEMLLLVLSAGQARTARSPVVLGGLVPYLILRFGMV